MSYFRFLFLVCSRLRGLSCPKIATQQSKTLLFKFTKKLQAIGRAGTRRWNYTTCYIRIVWIKYNSVQFYLSPLQVPSMQYPSMAQCCHAWVLTSTPRAAQWTGQPPNLSHWRWRSTSIPIVSSRSYTRNGSKNVNSKWGALLPFEPSGYSDSDSFIYCYLDRESFKVFQRDRQCQSCRKVIDD